MIKLVGKHHSASLLIHQSTELEMSQQNKDIYTEVSSTTPTRSMDSLMRVSNNLSIFNGRTANLIVCRALQNGTTRTFYVEPVVLQFLPEQRDRISNVFNNGNSRRP